LQNAGKVRLCITQKGSNMNELR